jgi:hypothetical protein
MKAALLLVALLSATAWAQGPAPQAPGLLSEREQQLGAAASAAQASCHARIHHDTYAYESCLLDLLRQERRSNTRRLGIEYFGYVGAMNSARMGMIGADETAQEFLTRFRRTQKRLRINDQSLCRAVPGDCSLRIAAIRQMEASAATHRPAPRDPSDEHQHAH